MRAGRALISRGCVGPVPRPDKPVFAASQHPAGPNGRGSWCLLSPGAAQRRGGHRQDRGPFVRCRWIWAGTRFVVGLLPIGVRYAETCVERFQRPRSGVLCVLCPCVLQHVLCPCVGCSWGCKAPWPRCGWGRGSSPQAGHWHGCGSRTGSLAAGSGCSPEEPHRVFNQSPG